MPDAFGAPQQRKQTSRKGKRAWRKNVDITDVQQGLEALREDIIQGGPLSEKPSEELFALDVAGSDEIKRKYRPSKPLKVDEILAKRSLVPAVDSRKRSGGGITDGVIEPSSKRQKKDWVSKKDVQRLRQIANTTSHLSRQEEGDVSGSAFDLWGTETTLDKASTQDLEYVPKPKAKVAPPSIKQAPIAMTASGKPIQPVQAPVAGASYNPSFEDWDHLLTTEGAKEVAAEQTRLRKAQEEADKQARVDAAAMDDAGQRGDEDSAWEGFETENEEEALTKKRPQRKTPAQRNKVKRRKEAERLAKHEKRMGEKEKQAEQILTALVARANDVGADQVLAEIEDHSSQDAEEKLRRRKIGNVPIPEKSLELVLPDELQDSLRQLKPEGNLLQERFRNLLVNGKIESRKPVLNPKKKKTKVTEKWSYKDFSIQV